MTTLKKTILQADSIPLVAIDFMNSTHFEELEMVKLLAESIEDFQHNSSATKQELTKMDHLLQQWFDHTQAHFDRENSLMKQCGFPMYSVHYGEHQHVLHQLNLMIESWKLSRDIDAVAEYVFSSWPDWFSTHVNSMDTVTALFALNNGYSNSQDHK